MKALFPGFDVEAFFGRLARAPARLLMLDYDGTLAPFVEDRDRAGPWPGVRERIRRLLDSGRTRAVLVSGRTAQDLLARLGLPDPVPEVFGVHGLERRRPDGTIERTEPGPEAARALDRAAALAGDHWPDGRLERKPGALAVHWRGAAPGTAARMEARLREAWPDMAREGGLELCAFDGGLELRAPGADKGAVVATLLREEGDGVAAAYLGDDLTDEDAFEALGDGGASALVRTEFRPTRAHLWLRPPGELLAFLDRWAGAEGGGGVS